MYVYKFRRLHIVSVRLYVTQQITTITYPSIGYIKKSIQHYITGLILVTVQQHVIEISAYFK